MFEVKTRNLSLELKQLSNAGEFEGLAAVYEVKDDGDDIIDRGAFAKTLKHKGGKVPVLWQHQINEVLGIGSLKDAEEGLEIVGKFNLDVARAREVHSLMKQAKGEGIPFGLSIGYDAIQSEFRGNVRHLKEVRLWEVSPTIFPMQPKATVRAVKTNGAGEGKPFGQYDSFDDCVSQNQDQDDPEAFCNFLQEQITGEPPGGKTADYRLRSIAAGISHAIVQLKAAHDDVAPHTGRTQAVAQLEAGIKALSVSIAEPPDPSTVASDTAAMISLWALMREIRSESQRRIA